MRFSIRSLLAVMLLFAISFPLVIGVRQTRHDEALLTQLANEIKNERQSLFLDDPQRLRVGQHQREEYLAIRKLRDKAEQHFQSLQDKYGHLEDRGADVLSLRTVPQLSLDSSSPPVVFRLNVPTKRKVWLRYALVPWDNHQQTPVDLDKADDAPKDSGFEHVGPYQIQLDPGERLLSVKTGPAIERVMPIVIRLDNQPLIKTRFSADGIPHSGAYHLSGREQLDIPQSRALPWLLYVRIRLENENKPSTNAAYCISLWLSDRPSQFDRFPQQASAAAGQ